MKKILSILLVLGICLLASCSAEPEDPFRPLTNEGKEEIAAAWQKQFGGTPIWDDGSGGNLRYYGTFGDCVVLFQKTLLQIIETKNIAGYLFSHSSSFILTVYREGEFLSLSDAYSKGYVTEAQVGEIHRYHTNYGKPASEKTE
ncbi:MAG: hypothetical protein E7651_01665 [Ruminococcaceae bacterium]|nr:hypothetical protein [Oscillospiraceae bacterium]